MKKYDFSPYIHAYLKASGLNVIEFARQTGVSKNMVYRLMNGTNVGLYAALRVIEGAGCRIEIIPSPTASPKTAPEHAQEQSHD